MTILVSACLLGVPCRYDGQSNQLPQLEQLLTSSSSEYSTLCDGRSDVFASLSVKHTSLSPLCVNSP